MNLISREGRRFNGLLNTKVLSGSFIRIMFIAQWRKPCFKWDKRLFECKNKGMSQVRQKKIDLLRDAFRDFEITLQSDVTIVCSSSYTA